MIRFGVLGAARIAPSALIRPAREVDGVVVAAIAARERGRAAAFARKHRIPKVHDSYEELLADREIDAVYIPLPNGLHAEWTLRALDAGKHVLCEKPFTSNRREAEEVAAAAEAARRRSGLVVMEAFHYRYHPLSARIEEIIHGDRGSGARAGGGELGAIREIEVSTCVPLPLMSDIRFQYDLAGGATMDIGCYALSALRFLGGEAPRVVAAAAKTLPRDRRIDRAMRAELVFPSGARGKVRASLWSSDLLSIGARVVGERGELKVVNFMAPHLFHRLTVTSGGRTRREHFDGRTTYSHQLEAFAHAVREGVAVMTSAREAVVNMGIIDDVYRGAGLPIRGTGEHEQSPGFGATRASR